MNNIEYIIKSFLRQLTNKYQQPSFNLIVSDVVSAYLNNKTAPLFQLTKKLRETIQKYHYIADNEENNDYIEFKMYQMINKIRE